MTNATKCLFGVRLAALLLVLLAPGVTGCLDWSYRQIRLGQEQGEYNRLLPAAGTRQTDLGICHLESDAFGRTDAIVLLQSRDRRLATKLRATHVERSFGFGTERGYWLRGELSPELAELSATGPIDTLRAIADDLASYRGEKIAMDAHGWVAAGLIRLIQRWPQPAGGGLRTEALADLLDRVPAGGEATMRIDEQGVYHFEYRHGKVP